MSVIPARGCGAAIVLLCTAQGAFADVSAQDVWSDWKSYFSGMGYQISGTEDQSGSTLTVSGVSVVMPVPEEEMTASFNLPEIQFVENGDGTVNVLLPKETPLTVEGDAEGDAFKVEILYSHDGSPMVVSGDPSEMVYDYASPEVSMAMTSIEVEGEDIPQDAIGFSVTLSGVDTKTTMTSGDLRTYVQSMTASALTYDFAFKDPEGGDAAELNGALNELTFDGSGSIPTGINSADTAAMLEAGFDFDGTFTYASGNTAMSGGDDTENVDFKSSSQGGSFAVAMSKENLAYELSQNAAEIQMSGSEFPFPVALSLAESGFKLKMPVSKSEEEQDFALAVTLRDFSVPENMWQLFDPNGELPHNPATLILDLAGKGRLLFDIFDPQALENIDSGDQEPGQLNALSLNQLLLSAAGAELTGTGDFTFNNEDLVSFGGFPAPSGAADLQLSGANALIDGLINLGLISDSDAMGARMMLGMFAVPGEAEDTLTSKIELREDGSILANGQRIK